MRRVSAFAVALLSAVVLHGVAWCAASAPTSAPRPETPLYGLASGSEYAVVDVGSQAPDFSFEFSGRPLRLRDLRQQGHVLLLFSPGDGEMLRLEGERPRLLSMEVVPVVVHDRRPGACRALGSKLHVGYTIVSDQRRVIGAQFNALDPSSRADAPAWFVIDRRGRVRSLAHGTWPARPWTEICAEALGLPLAEAPRPAANPR